ncbi:IS1182 family transposase [Sphingomonas sp. PL20]|jgi:transposase|uniref:IS1182 family transposase n=1 Tax=Sphingomonas sp. PL20 TaxID=2760712 RepID=UPI001AE927EC|nr:IS1182 family transposase [Candidatus Krumholzibacteria bacterium]
MGYIEGLSRDQMLLLPASVDDYVSADNPARFIAAFVDDLDLGELGFGRARPKATGRPGYDPADLLKLYLYGYLNRVRSSRCLAAEAGRNLEVMWLLGGLRPDFRTIADFRRVNVAAFKPLFRSFMLLCRRLDLFGRELLAVDGTRLKAVNSRRRNFTRQKLAGWITIADERIEEYVTRLDRADQAETEAEGASARAAVLTAKIARMRERRLRHSAMLAELVASGESQKSLTDPDSRGMAMHPKVGVGYNAQVAVDARHKLIVEQHVTNAGSDLGLLAQTAGAAREMLGVERIAAVADKGYYKGEDIAACETVGVVPYVARPERGPAIDDGYFAKSAFRYVAAQDCYICPASQRLDPFSRSVKDGHHTIRYGNRQACQDCALRPQCASGARRTISRWEGEAVLDRMAERIAARPDILDRHRETVEHPFGSIKQWMNQGAFLTRGLASVNAEFSLTSIAYNLRRAITIRGIPAMLQAMQA